MGAPPPLPPRAKRPLPAPPSVNASGEVSTSTKMSIAHFAFALREEQVQARVVHYKADLQTSPELDAITAQVVAELQQLQQAVATRTGKQDQPVDRAQVEIELIKNLKLGLGRLFQQGKPSSLVERKLGGVSKRFARLFFESELHDKVSGDKQEAKLMRYPEQALFHVFSRGEAEMVKRLESFEYASPDVLEQAKEQLGVFMSERKHEFLGKTTPELNRLLKMLNEVLLTFFARELPPILGELAWEVVREARLAEGELQAGYKVSAKAFPAFRQAFEKRFLQRLVTYAEDEMFRRVGAGDQDFRSETTRFLTEPQIFTDVCELVCDAVYDSLYNDGFLDLPGDWRVRLSTQA